MPTAQDLLTTTQYDFLEDGNFVLGVITQQEFIDLLNEATFDFIKETCFTSRVFTQTVFASQALYSVPDDIMRVENVFLAGRWLPKATQRELNNLARGWRTTSGTPRFWYEDGIPQKMIGLAPSPNYNSDFIIGPNEPDPPHAVYDSFSATVQLPSGQVYENPAQHRGLTIIGPNSPTTKIAVPGDQIPLLPADFAYGYLIHGVLQRILSSDSELHDDQKAAFCAAQVIEGMNLGKAITGEVST